MALLIAVGGSGQHVALAAARLAYIGALDPIETIVIDADVTSPLTRALMTFDPTGQTPAWNDHPLKVQAYRPLPDGDIANKRFEDLFLGPGAAALERELFEAYFDRSSADVLVEHGMFGNPAVGSTVFGHAAERALNPVLERAGHHRDAVYVAGSFIGGTGAGVLHQLVKRVGERLDNPELVHLIALLPWLEAQGGGAGQPIATLSQRNNMQYGCEYLADQTLRQLGTALLLGAVPNVLAPAAVNMNDGSREQPHLLHAVGAYYMHRRGSTRVVAKEDLNTAFTYAHDPQSPSWCSEVKWKDDKSLTSHIQRAQYAHAILDVLVKPEHEAGFLTTIEPTWGERVTGKPKDYLGKALYDSVATNHAPNLGKGFAKQVFGQLRVERDRLAFCVNWATAILGQITPGTATTAFRGNPTVEALRQAPLTALLPEGAGAKQTPDAIASHLRTRLLQTPQP